MEYNNYTSSVLLLVFEVSLSFAAGREVVQHLPLHRALPGRNII